MLNAAKNSSINQELDFHFFEIRKAQTNLKGVSKKTALIYSDVFSNESQNSVYIKPENLQITGIALAAKALNPNIKMIGAEPEGAKATKESLDNNGIVNLSTVRTIADGVAVKKPGALTFEIIRNYVDEIVTVSDFDIMESFLLLLEKHKLISEASGALSFAGLKKIQEKGKKIACVLSGGNIDVVTISSMIDRGLVSRGRLFCFSLEMPDIPGELVRVSTILAKVNANVVKLDHNHFKTNDCFMQVQLEITAETNGHNHVAKIINELNKGGYKVHKIY